MAISDKLNYLIETKSKFKDRLNSLGAEIIESTTFRNYLNWLDNFYIGSANKTDLAKNGIVGRTSQSGTPTPENPVEVNNISGDVEYRVRGQGISEIFPLSLGDIELCNISDYKDRIYSQNGEFYLEKKTGKVVLDGSEDWVYDSVSKYFRCPSYSFTELPLEMTSANRASYIQYSNNFTLNKAWSGTGSFRDTTDVSMFYPAQNSSYKIVLRNVNFTTTSDFSNWLSSNNTLIYYPLATPTTTKITEENYPTLYSQLLAIQEFLTKYKINKEFLLDYSSPEIEY